MARSNAGKWVARAGATGGGRTYRGNAPVNWYAALALIVIVGIFSVVFSNVEYRHSAAASTTLTPPTTHTTWYVGLALDICGTQAPSLPANTSTSTTQAFFTTGNGVVTVAPKTSSETGANAVLGKFVSGYRGMVLTATELKIPSSSGSVTYKNGERCKKGTTDAGKVADVQATYWPSAFTTKEKPIVFHGNPSTIKFSANQLITIGFVPPGTKLPKPNGTIVTALLQASQSTAPTTATTAPTTATTAPTTATTAPTTATTAPTTATTAPTTKK